MNLNPVETPNSHAKIEELSFTHDPDECYSIASNEEEEIFYDASDEDFPVRQKTPLKNKINALNKKNFRRVLNNIEKNNFEECELNFLLSLPQENLENILINAQKAISIQTNKITYQDVYKILNKELIDYEFKAFAKLFLIDSPENNQDKLKLYFHKNDITKKTEQYYNEIQKNKPEDKGELSTKKLFWKKFVGIFT